MKKHIEKLKKRPIHERKKLATIFAVTVTIGIIIIWLVILSIVKSPKSTNTEGSFNFDSLGQVFESVGEDFLEVENTFNKEKENFKNIQAELEDFAEAEVEKNELNVSENIKTLEGEL